MTDTDIERQLDNAGQTFRSMLDRFERLERELGEHIQRVEPWVGINGQARVRLERLEQALQSFLARVASGQDVASAAKAALETLAAVDAVQVGA